jgi:ABC-type uncharacterized transport system involved in gliding motility auxiliary subunit
MPGTRSVEEISSNPASMKVALVAKTAPVIIKVKNVSSRGDVGGNIGSDRIETGTFPVMAVATGKSTAPETAKAEKEENKDAKEPIEAGGKEIRIVAVGSSAFATNQSVNGRENRDLFLNAISYLLQDEDFISIRPKDATKSTLNITSGSSQLLLLGISWIYPFIFLAGGILFWIRRRQA